MPNRIEVQEVALAGADVHGNQILEVLLPRAIGGVETRYFLQPEGAERTVTRQANKGYALLFFTGDGEISSGRSAHRFSEAAAIAGTANRPNRITATGACLEYVEVTIDLKQDEYAAVQDREDFFVLVSRCVPYQEAIKSATTVSRTIIPPEVIPRFCMGSVEALGPDAVASHAHPMLEQFFFGLPGNACVVTADDAGASFGERALLHIPPGSHHGVQVGRGRRMHYVWMDFFRSEEDLAYIREQHKPVTG